jgi:large conductance mechanosensitive channel
MWSEFKSFLIKQNVLALAIAIVVGTALTTLVKALVDDFIMPIVAAALPSGEWQKATWSVGSIHFGVGDFIAVLINFIIIGFVAWRISKAFIRPPDEKSASVDCRFCKMKVDRAATRCPFCTSELSRSSLPAT